MKSYSPEQPGSLRRQWPLAANRFKDIANGLDHSAGPEEMNLMSGASYHRVSGVGREPSQACMNVSKFLTRINASREDDERTIAECVRLRRTYLLELRESGAALFRRRDHCLLGHR
jgi:hypothetical protein